MSFRRNHNVNREHGGRGAGCWCSVISAAIETAPTKRSDFSLCFTDEGGLWYDLGVLDRGGIVTVGNDSVRELTGSVNGHHAETSPLHPRIPLFANAAKQSSPEM